MACGIGHGIESNEDITYPVLELSFNVFILHTRSGMACSKVLQKDPAYHAALAGVAKTFLMHGQYEQPSLQQACSFASDMQKELLSCQKLEGLPRWVRESRLAMERFTMSVTLHAKEMWKEMISSSGVEHTISKIEEDKLDMPPELGKCFSVLKQGKLISELKEEPGDSMIQNVRTCSPWHRSR